MKEKKDQRTIVTQELDCAPPTTEFSRAKFNKRVSALNNFIEGGYTEAAHERVRQFAEYLRNGDPIPREHFLKFCEQLDRIAAGEDPKIVLGLKRRRGIAPRRERLDRHNDIAYRIWWKTMNGKTVEKAIAEFADSPEWPKLNGRKVQLEDARLAEAKLAWETFGQSYRELEKTGEQGLPNLKPRKRKK